MEGEGGIWGWKAVMEFRAGVQGWKAGLEFRDGRQGWSAVLAAFGTPCQHLTKAQTNYCWREPKPSISANFPPGATPLVANN